ncbi:MAG: hypothetical protein NTX61_05485 [Bacteroidetes bacterium]|nr:hypothetical protein [Bacteroidota bacterium]
MKNTGGTEKQVITPDIRPFIELDEKIKAELLNQVEEQGTVIVHCSFSAPIDISIRIWNSTFLVDRVSGSKSQLLHALNISYAPHWELVKAGTTKRFILIFSSLPKTCEVFDFIEEVPDSFGFEIYGIKRNSSDVYNVSINDSVF